MKRLLLAALAVLAIGLTGCGGGSGGPQKIADDTTRAVYNNDMTAATANFDSGLAPQVTRASVGMISDQMHQLGNYKGLTVAGMDLPARKYAFDAKFDNGDMTVVLKLDDAGKIAAYRVMPGPPK
jgi:hypothetical protein